MTNFYLKKNLCDSKERFDAFFLTLRMRLLRNAASLLSLQSRAALRTRLSWGSDGI